jgi:hypothetical protein
MSKASAELIEQMIETQCEKFALLPAPTPEQKRIDLIRRVDDEVYGALHRALPLRKRWSYRKIARTGTDQQRREFLLTHAPNRDAIVATELAIFRRLYS